MNVLGHDQVPRLTIKLCAECGEPSCPGEGGITGTTLQDVVVVREDDHVERLREAVEDLAMAVDLLNRARCTDLGTDDKSWWRAQRGRLVAKWGR